MGRRKGGWVDRQAELMSFGDVSDTARVTISSGGPWSRGAWSQSVVRAGPLAFIAPSSSWSRLLGGLPT